MDNVIIRLMLSVLQGPSPIAKKIKNNLLIMIKIWLMLSVFLELWSIGGFLTKIS
jgi:hypothetical protein